ncbi:hypothetical protein [Streptomyces sp. NRRL S-1022]|uniref:hypothetical protein n=1 Tax=Streptomyces sp. NRRL S-1022 TaxID=1463880 RepID=UPI00131D5C20|nr:hypothetical protein [Streptomyces sp. NRRL S-1022]
MDAARWYAATEAFLYAMKILNDEQRQASLHMYRAEAPLPQLIWRVRHAWRNRRLRADYDATMQRLRYDALTACRHYREQAGDLTRCVEAAREDEERMKRHTAGTEETGRA